MEPMLGRNGSPEQAGCVAISDRGATKMTIHTGKLRRRLRRLRLPMALDLLLGTLAAYVQQKRLRGLRDRPFMPGPV